jgi:queuine tRNA-ribosyltransferase
MYRLVSELAPQLPAERPRYLMGVGTPENIVHAVASGVDMFDCVLPTRNARNGWLYTSAGVLRVRNAEYAADLRPVDRCVVHLPSLQPCLPAPLPPRQEFSARAEHLHNLQLLRRLMRELREAVTETACAYVEEFHARPCKLCIITGYFFVSIRGIQP